MSQHFLALNVPDTYNPAVLTILDESVYSTRLKVDCIRLEIWAPGYNIQSTHTPAKDFHLNLDACALEIQTEDCGDTQADLPDGIYILRYSVSPNDKVFVEYNYLRVTQAMNKLMECRGQVELAPCIPTDEIEERLREMQFIEDLIKAAKIRVEIQHKPKEGLELLAYANKRLGKCCSDPCC
jgi:hypothetical protein